MNSVSLFIRHQYVEDEVKKLTYTTLYCGDVRRSVCARLRSWNAAQQDDGVDADRARLTQSPPPADD